MRALKRTMDNQLLDILHGIVESNRNFLTLENIRMLNYRDRPTILNNYFRMETTVTDLITRIYAQQQTNDIANSIVRLTVPSRFLEPVRVTPTTAQINNSLVTQNAQDAPCAICQDAISSDGVVLRHCSHGYHRTCILQWFSTSVRCPTCRHDIRETGQADQTFSA